MTIGEKVRRLRKEKGITQEELGVAIGVKKAAINKYETGIVVNLKKETIASLARALDVNPVWLMDEADGWPPVPSTKTLLARAFEEDRIAREKREQEEDEVVFAAADLFHSLSEEHRKAAMNYMKFLKSQEE